MERKTIIAGNWKMNYTSSQTKSLVAEFIDKVFDITDIELIICPVFTALHAAVEVSVNSKVSIGAQNVHWERNGAFTGEISAEMLKEISVEYVIIGHSERRQYFGETDQTTNQRLQAAINAELKPIFCVGETLEQRQDGQTETVISKQIKIGLDGISANQLEKITIAYEPVWAIGTGMTATPEQAQDVHEFIRKLIRNTFGGKVADRVRIQYGGSVKPNNIRELMSKPDIDGALVGGASLKVEDFSLLVHNARV